MKYSTLNHKFTKARRYTKEIIFLLCLMAAVTAGAMIKQRYGGNLKVAEELLPPTAASPLSYKIEGSSAVIDFSFLPADQITQLEKEIDAWKEPGDACHWIFDYPYLDHQHLNSVSIENARLILRAGESDFLNTLLLSSCLALPDIQRMQCFRSTQFGFEANPECLAGRPFLDSITPVVVDPLNPYLSFKLNEVDVFPVPEDKFQQIQSDPEISLIEGPRIFVYLTTSNMAAEQVRFVKAAINAAELSRSVLNDHTEILAFKESSDRSSVTFRELIYLQIPQESPYRLLTERLRVQLQEAGMNVRTGAPPVQNHPAGVLSLFARPIEDEDFEAFRYKLLKEISKASSKKSWFEIWDDLESSGKIVPLLIHKTRIAARKALMDLQTRKDGTPDFANCWIHEAP